MKAFFERVRISFRVIYHADMKISNPVSDIFRFFRSAFRIAGQGGILFLF